MGVPKLWPILSNAAEQRDFLECTLAGGYPKRTGVDASIWMYQVARALKHNNTVRGANPETRALFYRLARLLSAPMNPLFVFNGPERPETRRNAQVLNAEHQLTAQFQALIEVFGYPWYTAPGEAEAELGRLNNLGIIDIVMTTDIDALIFGAKTLMIPPNKKNDKNEIIIYHSSLIFINPGVCLSRGGLLLIALLAGGDYHQGLPGCGVALAHAVARGPLGDALLEAVLQNPEITDEFLDFLVSWRATLAWEFATDPHGYLGRKQRAIAANITSSFPNLGVLYAYTHPVTSWSENYSPPTYQSWGLPKPDVKKIASFCQRQFDWDAAKISSTFVKHLYSGIVMQSLLKPYDLHALLEAHVNSGISSDDDFPRSSVLQVVKTKKLHAVELYHVEISTGALSLHVKSGIQDASSFPITPLMRIWIPAPVVDYTFPDLVSRLAKSRSQLQGRSKPAPAPRKRNAHAVRAPTDVAPVAGSSRILVSAQEIIDLVSPEPEAQ
ncbi:PIN domain-like protein [Mycena galericulata]|nr:PIN domain-like protein [Mycena galericulata]